MGAQLTNLGHAPTIDEVLETWTIVAQRYGLPANALNAFNAGVEVWVGIESTGAVWMSYNTTITVPGCNLSIWLAPCPNTQPNTFAATLNPFTRRLISTTMSTQLPYICERTVLFPYNYTLSVSTTNAVVNAPSLTIAVNSPVTLNLTGTLVGWTALQPSQIVYNYTLMDSLYTVLGVPLSEMGTIISKELLTTPFTLVVPPFVAVNAQWNVSVGTPYNVWSDEHWFDMAYTYVNASTAITNTSAFIMDDSNWPVKLDEVNTVYTFTATMENGVSSMLVKNRANTTTVCVAQQHLITRTYFPASMNAALSVASYTPGDWQSAWTVNAQLVAQTMPAILEIATIYNAGRVLVCCTSTTCIPAASGECSGTWHHYNSSEYMLVTTMQANYAAAGKCSS
jgi:hypothetical protein